MSSARDLFELSKYLYKYRPDVLGMTKIKQYTIATSTLSSAKIFNSTHPFINDNRFLGGKTGRTLAAGETMITVLDMGTKGKVAFIILGSTWGYREADTRYLINQL
jgi:D-alanyl-D-alanine carboxypeptidase